MKIVKIIAQAGLIYIIYIVSQYISNMISPIIVIPGSIIGMLLLVLMLCTGIIKMHNIEYVGGFLLKYMGFFFVPLIVSLIDTYVVVKDDALKLVVLFAVSCVCVMFVTCKVTDILMSYIERKKLL